MKPRGPNGRFIKACSTNVPSQDGLDMTFHLPSFKTALSWLIFIIFIIPYIYLGYKFNLLQYVLSILETLFGKECNELVKNGTSKKIF